MPAMKMSSLEDEEEEEEEEDPGEPLLVLFSASSSSWISWSRQLALQNAFSPLQCKATQPESLRDIMNHKFITRCQEQLLGSVGWLSGRMDGPVLSDCAANHGSIGLDPAFNKNRWNLVIIQDVVY